MQRLIKVSITTALYPQVVSQRIEFNVSGRLERVQQSTLVMSFLLMG
jgi:hypothetical protein